MKKTYVYPELAFLTHPGDVITTSDPYAEDQNWDEGSFTLPKL